MQAQHQAFTNSPHQQVSGFEARQNPQQAQLTKFDNALVGVLNASDPITGQRFQVRTGPNNHYYRNGLGTTVNSNNSPGPNYHPLQAEPQ